MRHDTMEGLCPVHKAAFTALATAMRPHGVFVFETYRSPAAQDEAYARGNSRARGGQSPHQFGMAVDYVPRHGLRGWHWPDPSASVWAVLRREATKLGLLNVIAWDRPHVECRCWPALRQKRAA